MFKSNANAIFNENKNKIVHTNDAGSIPQNILKIISDLNFCMLCNGFTSLFIIQTYDVTRDSV